ncbi:Ribosome-releasing factor 2, mitochondrial [Sphaceloma murrayae]|uniref:Ribosome-releasing factor 2, mitochondrial n=1 Tax=Sphaceloma murrayae TaxID=2082308 RepID=A0A2K1QWT0_9PEZI|nr:Ribosome-releasing factor 2, mitochondrial [Sphaceloma murrayae]
MTVSCLTTKLHVTRAIKLVHQARRLFSSTRGLRQDVPSPSKTRNIGIIAHIDAGKTTTTERMLYYSGLTRRLGDVDEGSTVTDFLPAERARGITIQSAAVTFTWPPTPPSASSASTSTRLSDTPHNINLIDTPGHADFTFEVLRSLRILDGAVCILDGVAGVEAQTEQVWKQASVYHIPRLVFVNKLDRDGAAFAKTVREVGTRLGAWPAVCQIPWWRSKDGKLQGVGDVIGLRALLYPEGGDGKSVDSFALEQLDGQHAIFADELRKARCALVELLSEHDDNMVERFLECEEDHLLISPVDIVRSLRKLTALTPQSITPLFAGASFRNIGVQPLLDAVVDLLPAPEERPDSEASLADRQIRLNDLLNGKIDVTKHSHLSGRKEKALQGAKTPLSLKNIETCALAFKVVSDPKRGVLVYIRVYSGSVRRNAQLYNTNLKTTERAQRMLRMYANDAVDVESIAAGQIGVIPGLKSTRTGDTLISYTGANPKVGPPPPLNSLQLRPITVPPPVFFTSVEPNSLAEEKHVHEQLALLLREDPSLNVTQDVDSGQTHLSGMGELHLEIARDRLINDLKANARIGSIRIGYREAITTPSSITEIIFDRDIAGKPTKAGCAASVTASEGIPVSPGAWSTDLADSNVMIVTTPGLDEDGLPIDADGPALPGSLSVDQLRSALRSGVSAALSRGPSFSFPLHSTAVHVTFDMTSHLFATTSPSALSAAARLAVTKALKSAVDASPGPSLMEPVMLATISVDEPSLGGVVHDISSARGGQIVSLDSDDASASTGPEAGDNKPVIDPARIYAPPDPFGGMQATDGVHAAGRMRQIVARVPLKEMVGYLKHLRSLTKGRGTFTMKVDQFERMSSQRVKVLMGEMRGGLD